MPGQQHPPMNGTYGMWATSGPSCSAKETPVWSSLASSGSAHSLLRAHPEGLVLCVGSFSPGTKKAYFPCPGAVVLVLSF